MDNMTVSNPGEQLQLILQKLYPFDPADHSSIFFHLDYALMGEGDMVRFTYDSCINHMVRRLITTAAFLKRRYDTDSFPSGRYIQEIRRHIRDFTRLPYQEIEKILTLLVECLKERDGKPAKTILTRLRKTSRSRGLFCYICGSEMDYENGDETDDKSRIEMDDEQIEEIHNAFEAEHRWPKAMGGKNGEENLIGACARCNRMKKNYINASDFHYEEISLVSDFDDKNFSTEFKWTYRIAILAKNEYKCVICGKDAQIVGKLYFARRETSDNWHFFNIDTYCGNHVPSEL
jgi:hypothetical protein